MANKNSLKVIAILMALMLAYQNCGGDFPMAAAVNQISNSSATTNNPNEQDPAASNEQVPVLPVDGVVKNRVADCFTNPNFNSCLFWKNPVAMNEAALPAAISGNSNLAAYQLHGVSIERADYDNSGFLKNPSIDVIARTDRALLPRVSTATGNFKFNYGNDVNHRFSQVMAFYWINAQIKYMAARVGKFFAKDQNIGVISWYPNLDNAFWDPENKIVVIGSLTDGGAEFSLGAEIYLHEMGHANVGYATNFSIYNLSTPGNKTRICSQQERNSTCCTDNTGCIGAIDEGQADYHAAIMFPSNTALGEALVNDVNGFDECLVLRRIDSNANLTAEQAYRACGNNALGEVHLMGRVYASIWWEVRKKAAVMSANDARSIDRLFSEHLMVLAASDSFGDALTKIKALDVTLFNGKYSASFQNEFDKRYITQ